MSNGKPSALGRFIRVVFWEDWGLKFVCFVLATLYWFYIDGELTEQREVAVSIPISELPLPEELEADPAHPNLDFKVEVRGSRRRVSFLTPDLIRINLRGAIPLPVPGDNKLEITREMATSDQAGVSVSNLTCKETTVKLLEVFKRRIPLKYPPNVKGRLPDGCRVLQVHVEPREVTVQSVMNLDAVDFVGTEPIDLTDHATDFETRVGVLPTVRAKDQTIPIRCLEKIKVMFQIRRTETTRAMEKLPVQLLAPSGMMLGIDPPVENVLLRGAPEDINELNPAQIKLYVEWPTDWPGGDVTGQETKDFPRVKTVPVKFIAPPNVQVRAPNGDPLPPVQITFKASVHQ